MQNDDNLPPVIRTILGGIVLFALLMAATGSWGGACSAHENQVCPEPVRAQFPLPQ